MRREDHDAADVLHGDDLLVDLPVLFPRVKVPAVVVVPWLLRLADVARALCVSVNERVLDEVAPVKMELPPVAAFVAIQELPADAPFAFRSRPPHLIDPPIDLALRIVWVPGSGRSGRSRRGRVQVLSGGISCGSGMSNE